MKAIDYYCNCSLQTRSLGSWISAYLSQVYSIFGFPSGPLLSVRSILNISAVETNCEVAMKPQVSFMVVCYHTIAFTIDSDISATMNKNATPLNV